MVALRGSGLNAGFEGLETAIVSWAERLCKGQIADRMKIKSILYIVLKLLFTGHNLNICEPEEQI